MSDKTHRGRPNSRVLIDGHNTSCTVPNRERENRPPKSITDGGHPTPDREQIFLTTALQQLRGVIGRYPEAGQEYVFEFDTVGKRCVHMLAVTQPLQVEFYVDGDLVREERLSPWTGFACARCDRVVERRPS